MGSKADAKESWDICEYLPEEEVCVGISSKCNQTD